MESKEAKIRKLAMQLKDLHMASSVEDAFARAKEVIENSESDEKKSIGEMMGNEVEEIKEELDEIKKELKKEEKESDKDKEEFKEVKEDSDDLKEDVEKVDDVVEMAEEVQKE